MTMDRGGSEGATPPEAGAVPPRPALEVLLPEGTPAEKGPAEEGDAMVWDK